MKPSLILILFIVSFATLYAQNDSKTIGSIDEFDCRIDSFTLNHSNAALNELWRYSYNSESLISSIERISKRPNSTPIPFERTRFDYDENNHQTMIITETFDDQKSLWVPKIKEETIFDFNHQIVSNASYEWNNTHERWVGMGSKTEYSYPSAQLHEQIIYSFETATNRWIEKMKIRKGFNNQQRTTTTYFDYQTGIWTEQSKEEQELSPDGETLTETFFEQNETWTPCFRRVIVNDKETKQTTETTESYISNNWTPVYRQIVTHNADQETIKVEEDNYDFNTDQWVAVKKETYSKSYQEEQPKVSILCDMGNVQNTFSTELVQKDELITAKTNLEYADGALSELLATTQNRYSNGILKNFSISQPVVNEVIENSWSYNDQTKQGYIDVTYHSPINQFSVHFYVSEIGRVPTPVVPDDSQLSLKMYPNPVVDRLYIEHRYAQPDQVNYILYAINGKVARFGHLKSNNSQLDLSSLSSGVYLINVRFGTDKVQSKVIIKQ